MNNPPYNFISCGLCGAQMDITSADIGQTAMIVMPTHVTGVFPEDIGSPNTMLPAENITDPDTCKMSGQLCFVHVISTKAEN